MEIIIIYKVINIMKEFKNYCGRGFAYNTYVTGNDKLFPNSRDEVNKKEDNTKIIAQFDVLDNNLTKLFGSFRGQYDNFFSKIEIDNTEISLQDLIFSNNSWNYQLPKGKHIIKYTLNNSNILPGTIFNNIDNIISLTLSNNITILEESCIIGCKKLKQINIPNSVQEIGDDVLESCPLITNLYISEYVTNIGSYFCANNNLVSIKVNKNNPKYDSRNDCNAIIETETNTLITGCKNTIIPDTIINIAPGAFFECYELTNINIPNSVTTIGESSFNSCLRLTHIEIPNSVTAIDNTAFIRCYFTNNNFINNTNLDSNSNEYWGASIIDSDTNGYCISSYYNSYQNRQIVNLQLYRGEVIPIIIPDGVTDLNIGLIKELYDSSIISIGKINSDSSIQIPNSVVSIDSLAKNLSELTTVVLSNNITNISARAFALCPKLTSFTIEAINPPHIGINLFDGSNNLRIYVPAQSVEAYKSASGWSNYADYIEAIP